MTRPLLSVIVPIVSDTMRRTADSTHLARNLEALSQQGDPPPFEILVPHVPGVEGLEQLAARFPQVVFLPVPDLETFTGHGGSREHHDELRARGVAAARGEIVALLEDHARPDRHWCRRIVEAHHADVAAVGGAIENDIDRPLNWAVYFCDFGRYQNPVVAGEAASVSDANVGYKRSALESIGPVWRRSFRETAVNETLVSRGEKLVLSPEVIVYQHRSGLKLASALAERFIWGRSYAFARSSLTSPARRLAYGAFAPVLPALLVARMTANVMRKRRCRRAFIRALPLTLLLAASWSAGEMAGYLRSRGRRSSSSKGPRPTVTRGDGKKGRKDPTL
jgi:hypothetical protein